MEERSLLERLKYDPEDDFIKLLHAYRHDNTFDYNRRIKPFFERIRRNDPACMNHADEVLAFSLGGSKTKVMLARTRNGCLEVTHFVVRKNPTQYIHFYDFLDELFLQDEVIRDYLLNSEHPALCVTIPFMIGDDNIPFHPVKVKYITHLLARNESEMTEELNLKNNLEGYFRSRKLRTPLFYFQGDSIIAHLGGLFLLAERKAEERSLLMVSGTGMATADDNIMRVVSRLRMMDFDEELFPEDFTEEYVYETASSGKGLYDIMRRGIHIKSREPDSVLSQYDLDGYFADLYDSVTVARIWEASIDPTAANETVEKIRSQVSPGAMKELEQIAEEIMERVIGSLANSILVSTIKMNDENGEGDYYIIYEGSIALDPYINERVIESMRSRLAHRELFEAENAAVPRIDFEKRPYKQITFMEDISEEEKEKVDITLVGTAIAAVVYDVINR